MTIHSVKNQEAQEALVVNQPIEQSSAAKTVQIAKKLRTPVYYEEELEYKEKIFRKLMYEKAFRHIIHELKYLIELELKTKHSY